jgi:hypothetical protein
MIRAERREETSRRIVEATVWLHREVGPAKTTAAEIARRALGERSSLFVGQFSGAVEMTAARRGLSPSRPREGTGSDEKRWET